MTSATATAVAPLKQIKHDSTVDIQIPVQRKDVKEVVAQWRVPIRGKLYQIEFEHGTTSGKRVIWVDGKEILRRDWMFKLVGEDIFFLEEGKRCIIRVDPLPGFKYNYLLFVDGKSYEQYTESLSKALKTWEITLNEVPYRVVLEKDTLNVYLNGYLRSETAEFIDGGTETEFEQDAHVFKLTATTSGNKREGIVHTLTVDGIQVPLISDLNMNDKK
ncbi:fas apoptotic inhibitory molecule 1 [Culicoides brevitarsis]|uniref:fas apoptotic inhibitory molecule 1 n=1 Tax=Culicoides brevitarsis TaxID=469753 RepID=UPI00307BC554